MTKRTLLRILIITMILLFSLVVITYLYLILTKMPKEARSLSPEELMEIKKMLDKALRNLIRDPEFINQYGRSRKNPLFLTTFYLRTICNPQFIAIFIEIIPVLELCNIYTTSHDLLFTVEQIFYLYVEEHQKRFEEPFIRVVNVMLNMTKVISAIHFYNMIRTMITIDIITPETYNKIFSIKPLDILTIVTTIGSIIAYIWK